MVKMSDCLSENAGSIPTIPAILKNSPIRLEILEMTAEDKARNLLRDLGVENVHEYTSGDLVELANMINERDYRRERDAKRIKPNKFCYAVSMRVVKGKMLPRFYGIAWMDPQFDRVYLMLKPFNIFAGAFRNWWLELNRPSEHDPIVKAFDDGFRKGELSSTSRAHQAGYKQGWNDHEADFMARIERIYSLNRS